MNVQGWLMGFITLHENQIKLPYDLVECWDVMLRLSWYFWGKGNYLRVPISSPSNMRQVVSGYKESTVGRHPWPIFIRSPNKTPTKKKKQKKKQNKTKQSKAKQQKTKIKKLNKDRPPQKKTTPMRI